MVFFSMNNANGKLSRFQESLCATNEENGEFIDAQYNKLE